MVAVLSALITLTGAHGAGSPTTQPEPAPKTFAEAVKLTDPEAAALTAVRDRNQQLDETAFYMLLGKATQLAPIAAEAPGQLDTPALGNLAEHPARYRGWPVRLSLRVIRVEGLTAPADFVRPPDWPVDRMIWKMDCYGPADSAYRDMPVMVFTTIEPTALGKATRTGAEGERYYSRRRQFRVDGFFYKLYESLDQTEQLRYYPVVLAWAVERANGQPAPGRKKKRPEMLLLFIAGLLIVYLFARRHFRRQARAADQYRYRPLRQDISSKQPKSP